MSEIVSIKRSNGILNGNKLSHATLHGSTVRAAHIPNFTIVEKYIEFISIEHSLLIEEESQGIYEPVVVDIGGLISSCDLPYKNIYHFLMIITEDGKYGEFEGSTSSANLTKQALFNLLKILGENTQKFFLKKNLIETSDIQKKTNKVILDKKTLVGLIISRGLHSLSGLTPSQMISSVVESFEEGIHFTKVTETRYNSPNAIILTSEGVEFLARGVNQQVLFSLLKNNNPEKIAA